METQLHLHPRRHPGLADAFGELVRDHAGMVFATAKRVTRDDALAQDVAQETFLELARGRHVPVECVGAWLHRVAWRKACNAIRGESRRRRHEQAAAAVLHKGDEASWDDVAPLLDEALEELPGHLRAPLVSHYLEGRTQQELAARMGVSQSTVSRQLEAALRELRSRLRTRGVLTGAGLALLLGTQSAEAAPPALTTALGKLTVSSATTGTTTALSSTLIAMTTTTKILLTAAAVAAISVPLALQHTPSSSADKRPTPPAPASVAVVTKTQAGKPAPPAGTRHYRPAAVSPQVQQKVEGIIRRHRGMTMDQLMRSAELLALMEQMNKMMEKLDLTKLEQAIADLQQVTGVEHGQMNVAFDVLDDAKSRAWLEAAVSGDAELMEAWLVNRFEGAIFEFAIDPSLEKTSEGVTIIPDKRFSKDNIPADDQD